MQGNCDKNKTRGEGTEKTETGYRLLYTDVLFPVLNERFITASSVVAYGEERIPMVCAKELERDVLNGIIENIVDAARNVHTILGPGLLESAYETCMTFELIDRGLKIERQKPLPVVYRKIRLDYGHRLHLLVEEAVIMEIKTVDALLPSMRHISFPI